MDEIPRIKPATEPDIDQIRPNTTKYKEDKKSRRSYNKLLDMMPKFKVKISRRLLVGLGLALVLVIIFVLFPLFTVYMGGRKVYASAKKLQTSFDSKDIAKVEEELGNFKKDLESFQGTYKKLSFFGAVPFLGSYYGDGRAALAAGYHGVEAAEIIIDTIKPYADIIGFAGPESETAQSGEDTANDRIEFIIQTIDSVLPRIDELSEKAKLANTELEKINPDRYPKRIGNTEVRSKLKSIIDLSGEATRFVSESKPLLESAPYLLGIDEERTYLLLFQNDKELRPTGGFITAYSIMNVRNGKVQPVVSSDIYDLDNRYRPAVEAPEPIINYIQGPYKLSSKLYLRDINWNPDFSESMDVFTKEAEKAGIKNIDGVVAVDTEVAVRILDVIGQIGVPGFGNFSTEITPECDCPQVVYELESFADIEGPVVWSENEPGKIVFAPPNYDNRKKIVGPLMNSILSNTLGQPKEKLPDLIEAGWDLLRQKHILVYFFDEKAQEGAQGFGIAGTIKDYDKDYLLVADANLGGRKSNLYVTQEVVQDIEVKRDGTVEKTLTITYQNPKEHDGWLNSVLPNWTRVYVPKGSELLDLEGFEDRAEPYEESGKTVFAGGFELRPQGIKKIIVTYRLPFKVEDKEYKLFIQKQPGTKDYLYTINLGKKSEEFFLKTDKEFKLRI